MWVNLLSNFGGYIQFLSLSIEYDYKAPSNFISQSLLKSPVTQVEELRLQMAELNQQLARADERYNARPSRPEDLNKILQLENTIVEADERIKHLIVRVFLQCIKLIGSFKFIV